MSDGMNPADDDAVPFSMAKKIDAICDEFESAWQFRSRPDLQAFVSRVTAEERVSLLRELIHLDVAFRIRSGEIPKVSEYLEPFPELDVNWLASVVHRSGEVDVEEHTVVV